jgi:methylamine dehydrogenase accessory protein MauD
MNSILLISSVLLWVTVLALGFLLLGTLRSMGLLEWRLDQIEATRPARLGREGLKIGAKAASFTLPDAAAGTSVSLDDFAGRKVLLVFTQTGCGPCHEVMPELNRVQQRGRQQVLVINNGDPDETADWAREADAPFPVLTQDNWTVSRRYKVFATPFAFLIDEQGVVASKGIASTRQYLDFVLSGAGNRNQPHAEPENDSIVERETVSSTSKEVIHA